MPSEDEGGTSAPEAPGRSPGAARMLTLWSWLMLPTLIASFLVGGALGYAFLGLLGLHRGDLLSFAGVAGWAALIVVLVIGALPVIVGVGLGLRAVRAGGGRPAVAATVVNALVLCYLVAVQLLAQAVR